MIRALLLLLLMATPAWAAPTRLDLHGFAQLPVQREGRIVPFDSFARSLMHECDIVTPQTPAAWLAELLLDPASAMGEAYFEVAHPGVRHALGLPERDKHRYSFRELTSAIAARPEMMRSLLTADAAQVSDPAQREILALYPHLLRYAEMSRSLSLVLPDFRVENAEIAEATGLPRGENFSYLTLSGHKAAYLKLARARLAKLGNHPPSEVEVGLLAIGYGLEQIEADKKTRLFAIIPPAWGSAGDGWSSPWGMFDAGQGSPQTAALLASWQRLAVAWRAQDAAGWAESERAVTEGTRELAGAHVRGSALAAEYFYNLAHLFALSGGLYGLALLAYALARGRAARGLRRVSIGALGLGFLLHTLGLGLRIYILARPPVGTLYESILFVGWISVLGGLIMLGRGQARGVMIGALLGVGLQSLAPLFAQGGDTMEPLVAVLNTNFWLATHVLAITTGYGCCLLTALLAHLYLFQRLRGAAGRDQANQLARGTLAAALVAVAFATIGTILGGIWADQSWGRFWGWDPKENGALLIVLWLLFLLHGKLSGLLRADGFAFTAAATIIVVALSWFGVNLLNVGLHSYGFTSGIALYLSLFVTAELILLGVCQLLLNRQRPA